MYGVGMLLEKVNSLDFGKIFPSVKSKCRVF